MHTVGLQGVQIPFLASRSSITSGLDKQSTKCSVDFEGKKGYTWYAVGTLFKDMVLKELARHHAAARAMQLVINSSLFRPPFFRRRNPYKFL